MQLATLLITSLVKTIASWVIIPRCTRYNDNQIPAHLKQLPVKCLQRPSFVGCLFFNDGYKFNPSKGRCDSVQVGYCGGCKVFSSLASCERLCERTSV
ncbi:hypothetical protein DSO57_1033015 [Entomophthora muscae]|uniref:Uncharacterized protein n=1 Tax=Entomophthora muscae TaxID=34485 RepID=A0ACC2SCV5_9FUNG|nr:hypothetical protein DSO57_1033015 [Entomophthora muscae]